MFDANPQSNSNNSIPAVTSGDGIKALLDFKFNKFITPSLIRWLYVVLFVLTLIVLAVGELGLLIAFLGSLFDKNKPTGLFFLGIIFSPVAALIYLISVRIWLEWLMAFFNLERLTRQIEENTRKG